MQPREICTHKSFLGKTCAFVIFCSLVSALALTQTHSKAIQIFTATDGIIMDRRPGYLSLDKDGLLWLGSRNGLYSFDGFHFQQYILPDSLIGNAPQNFVFNFQDNDGNFWVHVKQKGLYHFNKGKETFTTFKLPPSLEKRYGLDSMNMLYPFEDSKKRIWFCQTFHGMLRVDTRTYETAFFPIKDTTQLDPWVSATNISSMLEMNDKIYMASNDGMVEMNAETGNYHIYKEFKKEPRTQTSCLLIRLLKGNNKDEIICTSWGSGIKIYNTVSHTFSTHLMEPNRDPTHNIIIDATPLNDSNFFCVKRDSLGQTGFVIFHAQQGTFTLLKDIEPIYTWREYNFFARKGDFLWVPNLSQLYRFHLPSLLQDGLLENATLPKNLKQTLQVTPSEIWVNGNEQNASTKSLQLPAGQNSFRIHYACLGATRQDSLLFAYKLDGLNNQWQYDREAAIQYNNIPHGNYTLRIRVEKSPYSNTATEYYLPISIAAYWWQSWWFKIMGSAITMIIVYMAYHYRISQIKKEAALKTAYEKQIAAMEMKALRAQMNPHFIFNCLNSINKYIVKNDHKNASNYLTKFAKLVRMILDNSAADFITLQMEIETLELYLQMESMRFHQTFDYHIDVENIANIETLYIPSMLLQPYVENAIWHGLLHKKNGRGVLKIKVEKNGERHIEVCIEDNGIGRQEAANLKSKEANKTKSYGMQISSNRIALISSTYKINAQVNVTDLTDNECGPIGTRVIVTLPSF